MNRTPRPSDLNQLEEQEAMLLAENSRLNVVVNNLKSSNRTLAAENAKFKESFAGCEKCKAQYEDENKALTERIEKLEKVLSKAISALQDIHRLDINSGTCPEAIGSGECDMCRYINEIEQALQQKEGEKLCEIKRLKQLMVRHRICVRCGNQLSEAEYKSVHSCMEEKGK